ncbi:MAG: hypothetical protein QOK23_4056 [Gammaproteobacteria bacterium]|jgi:hypothetical protein|nr:hypothetical protein [Gammaproteobacteria bacterium]
MNRFTRTLALAAVAVGTTAIAAMAEADVSIDIGAEPTCPYGYYDTAPYACAPYGYYGPEWFSGGIFIGAGPWFRGPDHFHGHVNNRFDVNRGYRGALPNRGDQPDQHVDHIDNFRGNEMRDGHGGHVGGGRR